MISTAFSTSPYSGGDWARRLIKRVAGRAQILSVKIEWLARELGIPEVAEQSQILFELWRELRNRGRWLLIFDNVESRRIIERFWSPAGTGSILITSRNLAWGNLAHTIMVDVFEPAAAITFLLKRGKSTEEPAASVITKKLGYLPLALEQAGAYVEETRTSLEAYADLLVANRHQLLTLGQPNWYRETVATTWTVSIRPACGRNNRTPVTCSACSPTSLPMTYLADFYMNMPRFLASLCGRSYQTRSSMTVCLPPSSPSLLLARILFES